MRGSMCLYACVYTYIYTYIYIYIFTHHHPLPSPNYLSTSAHLLPPPAEEIHFDSCPKKTLNAIDLARIPILR